MDPVPDDYLPQEDPTPVQPAPVLVAKPDSNRIVCEWCGRLTRTHPIARPVPHNGGPALEPKTPGFIDGPVRITPAKVAKTIQLPKPPKDP